MKAFRFFPVLIASIFVFQSAVAQETWSVVLQPGLESDEAIKVALDDLMEAGAPHQISFKIETPENISSDKTLMVDIPGDQKQVRKLAASLHKDQPLNKNGYRIASVSNQEKRTILISGSDILGATYGLFWISDRIKVSASLPEIDVIREPELEIRFSGGSTKDQMRQALRNGATWVWGSHSVNQLIPWDSEPEASVNAKNRKETQELIDYAHSLHLKFIVYEDEFSYHPSLLKEFSATLNPEDPAFWKAVQAKYRRLLDAMPGIDGVRHRTGESTRVGGSYHSFDMMHDGDSHWGLAKRYRTWIQKIHEVVVGEYDKIYYQRTWVTSAHEQHSMAEVYKEIFTDDIPVKNLYMSPYMSTTDRYFHQPYNPTFNQTPHNMIVLLSPLNYHGNNNCGILPTFPGTYYQGGLKTYLSRENSNCKGADFGATAKEGWDTWTLTAYTVYRLTWDPHMDVEEIAHDFAAQYFGKNVAREVAEIMMLTPRIYKYGMYIAPAAHGQFASLTHLRLTTFPVKGLPHLDSGRKHMEFLQDIYLRCRPWIDETYMELDHGLKLAQEARNKAVEIAPKVKDKEKAAELLGNANMTYHLVKTNNRYVKAMISYFQYMETSTESYKKQLISATEELETAMTEFSNQPGFVYRLDGMKQLQINIADAIKDPVKAKQRLSEAPGDAGINELIDDQQARYAKLLEEYKDEAVKLLYWQARVDGRDLLRIKGKTSEIEHLRYDPIQENTENFFTTLPEKEYTVIVKNIQSRSYGPFILEQPSAKNNYTVSLYLSDSPMHGYSWWKFELYYIPKSPVELGLDVPWDQQ